MAGDLNTEALLARVGATFAGKYKLVRLLGAGGMGAVYEAQNSWTERRVAVKLLLGTPTDDNDLAARFLREARAASKIDHPNVVQILDMGQAEDGSLYIVQEFLSGHDLRHVLDTEKTVPPKEALELIAPVMAALIVAHRHGIVHRDLKPENIFLAKLSTGNVVPKLIDFGIAKMAENAGDNRLTRTGAAMGTPYYMSPEQASGEKTIDAQTDVWAMGVVLFEMLTGRCPFEADNYNALIMQIAHGPVPRIETFSPTLPKSLAAVVNRALERDRERRFKTIAQFLGALLDCEAFGAAEWHRTLRSSHRKSVDDDEVTNVVKPALAEVPRISTFDEGPKWADRAKNSSTMGESAREIATKPATRLGTRTWVGLAVPVAVAALVWVTFFSRKSVRTSGVAAAPIATAPVSAPVPVVALDQSYVVQMTVNPPNGTITLDGERAGASMLGRRFPRDGTTHRARVAAPGFETTVVEFTDAPPPTQAVTLVPMRGGRAIAARRSGATTADAHVAAPAAATEPAPTATPTTTAPTPRGSNGAPVVGE